MKFCSVCGAKVSLKIPSGDNRKRHVCTVCEYIHYRNPCVVAGCIPAYKDKILLCKRSIEPRYGFWTLPAGFMELGETSLQAAVRETYEEANAIVEVQELYAVFNLPHVEQVYMMFRSRLINLDFSPGDESLEVELFGESEIPWNDLAFTTIRQTLKFYFADCETENFRLHTGDIIKQGERYSFRAGPGENIRD